MVLHECNSPARFRNGITIRSSVIVHLCLGFMRPGDFNLRPVDLEKHNELSPIHILYDVVRYFTTSYGVMHCVNAPLCFALSTVPVSDTRTRRLIYVDFVILF